MEVEAVAKDAHLSPPDTLRQSRDDPSDSTRVEAFRMKLSPSVLSRKIVCPAYIPASWKAGDRIRFLGLHAIAALQTIGRHLRAGYRLKAIEKQGNGFRIDLVFESSSGSTRRSEVKSAKRITEAHRLQAALYWDKSCDEIVVSNGEGDVVLTEEYVRSAQRKAELTLQLLTTRPEIAASTFHPNESICHICANSRCPFLLGMSSPMARPPQERVSSQNDSRV